MIPSYKLDQDTSFFDVYHSVQPENLNDTNYLLRGRFAISCVTSAVCYIARLALSIILNPIEYFLNSAVGSRENNLKIESHKYSLSESYNGIWDPINVIYRTHLLNAQTTIQGAILGAAELRYNTPDFAKAFARLDHVQQGHFFNSVLEILQHKNGLNPDESYRLAEMFPVEILQQEGILGVLVETCIPSNDVTLAMLLALKVSPINIDRIEPCRSLMTAKDMTTILMDCLALGKDMEDLVLIQQVMKALLYKPGPNCAVLDRLLYEDRLLMEKILTTSDDLILNPSYVHWAVDYAADDLAATIMHYFFTHSQKHLSKYEARDILLKLFSDNSEALILGSSDKYPLDQLNLCISSINEAFDERVVSSSVKHPEKEVQLRFPNAKRDLIVKPKKKEVVRGRQK